MKGHWITYTAEEYAWLEANCTLPAADYHAAFCAAFNRTDVSADNIKALRVRKGWRTGRTGRFPPGATPSNKGVKCAPGQGGRHPNAQRTQFKKDQPRSGFAVDLYKPIGTERLSKEGYLERKIHDGMPLQSRWRAVHLINWEALNGPLPESHCLKCLDGDRLNTDPANWDLIHRAVNARLNGGRHKKTLAYDEAAPELRPTILAIAKLKHRASTRAKKAELA